MFCISAWFDFEPVVLISRPISWAMKPSFLPCPWLVGHGLAEVLQVVGQTLLLLADVQLLDVVDELLLQTVLVVLHAGNLLQPVDDALANLLHAALLVGLDAGQQLLDVVNLLLKLLFKGGTLLLAEVHQCLDGLFHSLAGSGPLVVAQHLLLRLRQHVGHAQQRVHRVGRQGDARLLGDGHHLAVVVLDECAVDGGGVDRGVFLYPEAEVHLAAL